MAGFIFIVILYIYCLNHPIFTYNLDVHFPIIYADPKIDDVNSRNSYFGYSLLLSPGVTPHDKPWIQIGAPRANDSAFPDIKEPGIVYRCNIFENCSQFIVDSTGNERRQLHPKESYMDRKDGAWIGGAMDIDFASNKVAVCGHRWQNQRPPGYNRDYHIEGVCYVTYNNETQKLIPLLNSDKAALDNAIYYYAYGQAGISVHFPSVDYVPEMMVGAPGVYNWQGTTILYKEIADLQRFGSAHVSNPYYDLTSKYFYLQGYQVTSGRFFSRQKLVYVTGAPRALDCKGQVLLFDYSSNYGDDSIGKQIVQKGVQMGEYFGATLAVADVNGDKLDDLIVGSPLYDTDWEEGRVHVFLGSNRGSLSIPEEGAILVGQKSGARFGSAVVSLRDLDLDGYGDIAIGAPYENNHRGVVYIYNGGPRGLRETPSQVIKASDVYPKLKGFGISFAKSVDIDNNDFIDIGIGSYLSSHAVILRSKPVIYFNSSLSSSISRLERKVNKFSIEICVSFTGLFAPTNIRARRVLEVDLELLRIKIGKNIENGSFSTVVSLTNGVNNCENVELIIEKKITQFLAPIQIVLTQELVQDEPEPKINMIDGKKGPGVDNFCRSCVSVNERLSKKESRLEVPFALDCGDDNVCIANLEVKVSSNLKEDAYIIGSQNPLRLFINVTNTGEAAYMSQLMVVVPTDVNFRSQPENCEIFSANIECIIGNPLAQNEHVQVVLDLELANPSAIMFSENLNSLKLIISTMSKSDEADWADNSINVNIPLKTEASVALAGKTSNDVYSYQIDEDNVEVKNISFDHLFEVQKFGASPVDEILLQIFVPTIWNDGDTAEKFEILKIVELESRHGSQSFLCSVNDSNEITQYSKNEKNKDMLPPANRTLFLNCSSDEVLCKKIECIIGPIRSVQDNLATLQIVMELNVNTIGKKILGKKDIIYFTAEGSVSIKSPKILNEKSSLEFTTISTSFNAGFQNKPVEWWIVILSAIIGLLILLVVISGFAKAGFFKRKKKEELLIQKQMMAESEMNEEM